MFRTHMGPVDSDENLIYLRPGDGPGIFTNFENIRRTNRLSSPSGSPRWASPFATRSRPGQFVFRTREFEQMEMEYFVRPEEANEWFAYWQEQRFSWYLGLGMTEANLQDPAPRRG